MSEVWLRHSATGLRPARRIVSNTSVSWPERNLGVEIIRHRYSDGFRADDEHFTYPQAKLTQLDNNSNWPDQRYTMRTCEWPDYQDKPEGYQRFDMYGANMYLFYEDTYCLTGFVAEDTEKHQDVRVFYLKRWYCRVSKQEEETE